MATYDARSGTLGSVCRVMSGFSDAFYKANTIKYLGKEMGIDGDGADSDGGEGDGNDGDGGDGDGAEAADDGADGEDEGLQLFDEEDGNGDGSSTLLLDGPAAGVETGERAQFWFEPCEVWELRGADVTVSPVHMAAAGLVHPPPVASPCDFHASCASGTTSGLPMPQRPSSSRRCISSRRKVKPRSPNVCAHEACVCYVARALAPRLGSGANYRYARQGASPLNNNTEISDIKQ